jgi:hypothetical protein
LGYQEEPNRLVYFILEKGKGQDLNGFLQSFSGKKQLKTIYRLFGKYIFFYVLRPNIDQS